MQKQQEEESKKMDKSPGFKRRRSFNKYESVAVDIPQDVLANNNKDRTTIYITQSTQRAYDIISKVLSESRALLSYYNLQLYSNIGGSETAPNLTYHEFGIGSNSALSFYNGYMQQTKQFTLNIFILDWIAQ